MFPTVQFVPMQSVVQILLFLNVLFHCFRINCSLFISQFRINKIIVIVILSYFHFRLAHTFSRSERSFVFVHKF